MVTRKENETVDQLLSRFKREMQNSGKLLEYRKRQEYVGPSEKRRLKREAARRKMKLKKKGN